MRREKRCDEVLDLHREATKAVADAGDRLAGAMTAAVIGIAV